MVKLGTVVEASTTSEVEFVYEEGVRPQVGEYVAVRSDDGWVLGMVTHVIRGSRELTGRSLLSAEDADRVIRLVGEPRQWAKGRVKLLGTVAGEGDSVRLDLPRTPPPSGADVIRAPAEELRRLLCPEGGIEVGTLLTRPDVPVSVDPDELISRHLAILAVTGAGKSNAVAVLVDGILKMGGAVLLFDMHSEYVDMEVGEGEVLPAEPALNVNLLGVGEVARLLGISFEKAAKQYVYLRKFWRAARRVVAARRGAEVVQEAGLEGEDPDSMLDVTLALVSLAIRRLRGEDVISPAPDVQKRDEASVYSLMVRIEDLKERYGRILSPRARDVLSLLDYGRAVVVDLGSVGDEAADVIVGHYLGRLLLEAKRGGDVPIPIMVVLEEAHALIPEGRETYTRSAASRIAREGRKFGVSLTLVSQRPKRLDSDVLSQMVNKIILRIVEPEDQAYVRRATEFLSEELIAYLPSLNVGEAVLVGPMVRMPAIVKIRLFPGKRAGAGISAKRAWASRRAQRGEWTPEGYGRVVR
ncbi:MAG: ATP-binding protein [Thermoproteota archaeon]|nr:MAG: ATP-binding protein [Candidatus Korarchaeota archaeon]